MVYNQIPMSFESIKTPAQILEQDSTNQPELERTVRLLIAKAAKKLLAQVPDGKKNPTTAFHIPVAGAGQLVRQVLDDPADDFVEFRDTMPMMERISGPLSPTVASALHDPSAEIPNDLCRISFQLEDDREIATVALSRVQPFPMDIQTQKDCRVLDRLAGYGTADDWGHCKLAPASQEYPRTYPPHPCAPKASWKFLPGYFVHDGMLVYRSTSRYRGITLRPLMNDAAYPLVRVPGLERSSAPDIREIISMARTRLNKEIEYRRERHEREMRFDRSFTDYEDGI